MLLTDVFRASKIEHATSARKERQLPPIPPITIPDDVNSLVDEAMLSEGMIAPPLVKGKWSGEEDRQLLEVIGVVGPGKWNNVASLMESRTGKQCRERWHNHLDSDIDKSPMTEEEDLTILRLYKIHGTKWAAIAKEMPGRTDNAVKNRFNSSLKKQAHILGSHDPLWMPASPPSKERIAQRGDADAAGVTDAESYRNAKRAKASHTNFTRRAVVPKFKFEDAICIPTGEQAFEVEEESGLHVLGVLPLTNKAVSVVVDEESDSDAMGDVWNILHVDSTSTPSWEGRSAGFHKSTVEAVGSCGMLLAKVEKVPIPETWFVDRFCASSACERISRMIGPLA